MVLSEITPLSAGEEEAYRTSDGTCPKTDWCIRAGHARDAMAVLVNENYQCMFHVSRRY